jgi:hypothetical protein
MFFIAHDIYFQIRSNPLSNSNINAITASASRIDSRH